MSGATFVRYYPTDWRKGCRYMTLAQEGLYIRICSYIYETGRRLPHNDSIAAKFMGIHTNAYIKIRNELDAEHGVLTKCDDGWTVQRVERELAKARKAQSEEVKLDPPRNADGAQHQNRRAEVAQQNTLQHSIKNTPSNTLENTPQDFSKSPNQINGAKKESSSTTHESVNIDADDSVRANLWDGLQVKIEQAAGDALESFAIAPGLMSLSTPLMWLEQGCDLERDVLPAIRVVAERRKGKGKIKDWNYFTQAVSNAKRDRERGLPAPTAEVIKPQATKQGGVYAELQRQKALRSAASA